MLEKDPNIYAVIKLKDCNILGRVIGISQDALTFRSVADEQLNLDSFHNMDVFTSGQMYIRDLPVKIISDKKSQDERSFSKMLTREIEVRFNGSEISNQLPKIKWR